MTDTLKKRWIIVGVIWLGALFFTYWNSNKIDLILEAEKNDEILLRDRQFWEHNNENIANILEKGELSFQHIESVKLGLLSVENKLVSLAINNGLTEVNMEALPDQSSEHGVPIDFSFKGSFSGMMLWLHALELDFPYLQIRSLKILIDRLKKQVDFSISIFYRYKLSVTEEDV